MFSNKKRWQRTALAVAAASAFGLWGTSASALSLGRISVLSALGEPLRAEIEILDITEEEASSLRPRVATPDTFRANGLEYGAYMNGLGITLQRRGNGQRYLRLENSRAINDPFVDLVLEASWSSGRIVRDYTLLLDPPNLNNNQAAAPQAAQVNAVPVRIEPAPEAVAPAPAADSAAPANEAASAPAEAAAAVAPTSETAAPAPAEAAAPAPTAAPTPEPAVAEEKAPTPPPAVTKAPEAVPVPAPAMRSSVTVKAGDTATKLALAQKTTEVSLDQMLVAMLRANPQAFVNGNVNRLRKGSVVDMPTTLDAQATSTPEARQILQTQSKDFNEYRRRLAEEVPGNTANAADRKSSGNVQTQVEEKKPATTTPDKLTLSKGSVQTPAPEDKALKERQAKALAEREAELAKNVAELDKLNKAAKPAAAPAPAPVPATPAPAPTATVQAPVATPAPAPAPEAPAPAAETAPAPAAPKPAAAPAPAPVEEPSLVDELLENPLVPAAGGGVVALLAGLMFFRSRQRKKSSSVDSSYLESRLQPDSFFGNSGGQQVDTNDAAGASSMVYSPSQLDAGDDVDPVAEADVYLAYGRDMQAEEILKEALRNHPGRLAVHQKLLEIYAKRRDAKSFAAVAKEAHKLSQGNGPEWEHICELGRELDPNNEFYHGGKPPASAPAPLQANNAPATPAYTPSPAPAPAAARAAPAAAAPNVDLDLDLDFSLDEAPSGGSASASLEAASSNTAPAPVAQATPAAPARDNLMNFDLGGLSLDLDTGGHSIEPTGSEDPLATKLALAQEFQSIGDTDGARALIEEILAEASGDMKARAESALAALS